MFKFLLYDGSTLSGDGDLINLETVERAKIEAVRTISEMMKADPMDLWKADDFRLVVQDQSGLTMFEIIVLATDSPSLCKISDIRAP